jgi:UDP-glucose 4-epimerase
MIFDGKRILVTGGTGSLGKVLVKRILSGQQGNPEKVIVFSRDEAKQHDMRLSFLHKTFATDDIIYQNFTRALEFRIGDVRSYGDICLAIKDVDIVINAAALKQVPTCEYFPHQAVMTNCQGTYNIINAIQQHGYSVETVVGVSTDKAAKPVNVMGMTKAIQERIFTSANVLIPDTRFICVRYGNVLASRGSVIPVFYDQIRRGGPVTITTKEMTRFLLSINQAVDVIFAALKDAKAGEIFIPRVASATIHNVAKALIGNRDIKIKIIGIRPGEKVHEILISEEECNHVAECGNYYVILSMLPELSNQRAGNKLKLDKEFSSADNLLSFADTVSLLKKYSLLDLSHSFNKEEDFLV